MRLRPAPAGSGQVSVWRLPHPAVTEPSDRHIRVEHPGALVAIKRAAVRTLGTSHAPSWYLPPADITSGLLRRSEPRSYCDRTGHVVYWHSAIGDELLCDVAPSSPAPMPAFAALRDQFAFYAGPLDRCTVDGEPVRPQPGGFYGGWITVGLAGPFKGVPGSMAW